MATVTPDRAPKNVDISQLPSLKDGMTMEEETSLRRKTCRFIEGAGKQLGFRRIAISTAQVMFHRVYAKHSFRDHDRFEVAVAAILLAGKTEESPKRLNDGTVVCLFYRIVCLFGCLLSVTMYCYYGDPFLAVAHNPFDLM